MRVEFVDPFIRAATSMFETMGSDTPERGALSMRATYFTTQQVTIVAGVNGDIKGSVLYGASMVTAQKIASAMIGEQIAEMQELGWSAISELGNIITGNALQFLFESGYTCNITPPSILRGMNVEVMTHTPALVVPLSTKFGRIEINVALSE